MWGKENCVKKKKLKINTLCVKTVKMNNVNHTWKKKQEKWKKIGKNQI